MKIGLIILLIWMLLVTSAIITAAGLALFKGVSSLKWSGLIILGACLCYGFISASLGVIEGVWTLTSPGLLVALTVGFAGVALTIIGIRGLVRTRTRGGENSPKA